MGMLKHKTAAPGIDIWHAPPPTILLRSVRSLGANALKMTRLLS